MLSLLGPDDTAVICVDLDVLEGQLDHLRAVFDKATLHAIPIKTMPHHRMLQELLANGFGLEAASMEVIELALAAGAAPSQLVFDSPAKTRREIERCQSDLPGMLLNANSLSEIERMPAHPSFRLGLRINPEVTSDAPGHFSVADPGSRFGVAISNRRAIVDACLRRPIIALHVHIGSQVSDVAAQVEGIRRIVELADEIDEARRRAGNADRIEVIDIGGGLHADEGPVSSANPSNLTLLAAELDTAVPRLFERQVVTEFGQWVHTHAGWAASVVEYMATSPRPHAVLHLGADYLVRNAYSAPAPYRFDSVARGDRDRERPDGVYDLDGPLCFAGDVIARSVVLPQLEEGDWVTIDGVGANTFGLWSRHCSRDVPAVVAIAAGRPTLWSPRHPVR